MSTAQYLYIAPMDEPLRIHFLIFIPQRQYKRQLLWFILDINIQMVITDMDVVFNYAAHQNQRAASADQWNEVNAEKGVLIIKGPQKTGLY